MGVRASLDIILNLATLQLPINEEEGKEHPDDPRYTRVPREKLVRSCRGKSSMTISREIGLPLRDEGIDALIKLRTTLRIIAEG